MRVWGTIPSGVGGFGHRLPGFPHRCQTDTRNARLEARHIFDHFGISSFADQCIHFLQLEGLGLLGLDGLPGVGHFGHGGLRRGTLRTSICR